ELERTYQAPDRHYHDLRHIEALRGLARQHRAALNDHEAVEAAIWFHDAVYDPRRSDNEEQSALLALARLGGRAANDRLDRIATMIRATAGQCCRDSPKRRRGATARCFSTWISPSSAARQRNLPPMSATCAVSMRSCRMPPGSAGAVA